MDPPAGVQLQENQHYNPYFPGGAIGMAQALYDEVIFWDLIYELNLMLNCYYFLSFKILYNWLKDGEKPFQLHSWYKYIQLILLLIYYKDHIL